MYGVEEPVRVLGRKAVSYEQERRQGRVIKRVKRDMYDAVLRLIRELTT